MYNAILLVEDSKDDELLFKRILRMAGVENPLFVVPDGEEAIAYLKGVRDFADREKHPLPAILFLDLRMPRMDGQEVLRYMKTQPALKGILICVLTNFGETKNLREAYSLGAHSFLTKPITGDDLQNLIVHFRQPWILSREPIPRKPVPQHG